MPDAALCFLAGFIASNLAVGLAGAAGADFDSLGATAAGLVGLWIGLIGSMAIVARNKGSDSFAVDFGLRFQGVRDAVGLPIGLGVAVGVTVLYAPLTHFIHDLGDKLDAPANKLADQAGHGAGFVLLGVLVLVGAPVAEELFYRGLLLRSIQRRFGPAAAIGGSAVLFAAAHFEALQFPGLLVLGVVLGTLAVRYDRIGLCIFVHSGFNVLAMVGLALRK